MFAATLLIAAILLFESWTSLRRYRDDRIVLADRAFRISSSFGSGSLDRITIAGELFELAPELVWLDQITRHLMTNVPISKGCSDGSGVEKLLVIAPKSSACAILATAKGRFVGAAFVRDTPVDLILLGPSVGPSSSNSP